MIAGRAVNGNAGKASIGRVFPEAFGRNHRGLNRQPRASSEPSIDSRDVFKSFLISARANSSSALS
jgi:hypothetical protein